MGEFTVFNAHEELIHMFELAAANMSHRSIQRILHGVPMEKYLRAPSKSEYATSLLQMRVSRCSRCCCNVSTLSGLSCCYFASHRFTWTFCGTGGDSRLDATK